MLFEAKVRHPPVLINYMQGYVNSIENVNVCSVVGSHLHRKSCQVFKTQKSVLGSYSPQICLLKNTIIAWGMEIEMKQNFQIFLLVAM